MEGLCSPPLASSDHKSIFEITNGTIDGAVTFDYSIFISARVRASELLIPTFPTFKDSPFGGIFPTSAGQPACQFEKECHQLSYFDCCLARLSVDTKRYPDKDSDILSAVE